MQNNNLLPNIKYAIFYQESHAFSRYFLRTKFFKKIIKLIITVLRMTFLNGACSILLALLESWPTWQSKFNSLSIFIPNSFTVFIFYY